MRAAWWVIALGLPGCCTEAGCESLVVVELVGGPAAVAEAQAAGGPGRVLVAAWAETESVEAWYAEASFVPPDLVTVDGNIRFDPSSDPWTLVVPGWGEAHAVRVAIDDEVRAEASLTIDWGAPYYPNGPLCGRACQGGTAEVDIP